MHALDATLGDQQQLAHLHARFAVARNDVRLHDHGLAGPKRLLRNRTRRAACGTEDRRQVAATVAVQQIVDNGEAGLFDHT